MSGIQDLAKYGRHGDNTMVHMNDREVAGLEALANRHGTQLTTNPNTGYPEAFSLKSILPTLVGVGASAATGGAASPWLIGGLTGATTAATTGSLERGVLSGLTAGGLSAVGGNLAAEGAAEGAAASQGLPPTADAQSQIFQNAGLDSANEALKATDGAGFATDWAAKNPSAAGVLGIDKVAGAPPPSGGMLSGISKNFKDMGQGVKNLMNPAEGGKTMGQFIGENKGGIMAAGYGGMGQMALADQEAQREKFQKEKDERERADRREYDSTVNTIRGNYRDAGVTMPRVTFAEGGMAKDEENQVSQDLALTYMDMGLDVPSRLQKFLPQNNKMQVRAPSFGGGFNLGSRSPYNQGAPSTINPMTNMAFGGRNNQSAYSGLEGLQNRNQDYEPSASPPRIQDSQEFAKGPMVQGADQVLQQFQGGGQGPQGQNPTVMGADQVLAEAKMADGGYIGGPGDGMSDDIDTSIDGEQPAALSDGEFVISSDVVSHLGNGSSEAGAQALYDMMDRIRKARTGREAQGKEIEPSEYLPG